MLEAERFSPNYVENLTYQWDGSGVGGPLGGHQVMRVEPHEWNRCPVKGIPESTDHT